MLTAAEERLCEGRIAVCVRIIIVVQHRASFSAALNNSDIPAADYPPATVVDKFVDMVRNDPVAMAIWSPSGVLNRGYAAKRCAVPAY